MLRIEKIKLKSFDFIYKRHIYPHLIRYSGNGHIKKVNLCCGSQKIPGYCGVDIVLDADLFMDLSRRELPFKPNSLDVVICVSGINYFTRMRAQQIIKQVYNTLKPGGIARFSIQDIESIAQRYIKKDTAFFFEKLPDGRERFEGVTLGDKFVSWFYTYATEGGFCKYAYDYESLAYLFKSAGFSIVERRNYLDSRLEHISDIDNRPEQMFFLEAVK